MIVRFRQWKQWVVVCVGCRMYKIMNMYTNNVKYKRFLIIKKKQQKIFLIKKSSYIILCPSDFHRNKRRPFIFIYFLIKRIPPFRRLREHIESNLWKIWKASHPFCTTAFRKAERPTYIVGHTAKLKKLTRTETALSFYERKFSIRWRERTTIITKRDAKLKRVIRTRPRTWKDSTLWQTATLLCKPSII